MLHRNGGKILAITHIGHETHKGVANWFFVGGVEWNDGTISDDLQIAPGCLCYESDEDREQINLHLGKLNDYLQAQGEWHEPKHKRDGRVYSWTPKQPAAKVAL